MNRVKLSIKTSKDKNLIYNIYRSTKQEDLPPNLSKLQHLDPALVVDESKSTAIIVDTKETLILDMSYNGKDKMVKYISKYEPIKSDTCKVNISINFNNPELLIKHESIKLEIKFDNSAKIIEIIKTNRDKTTESISNELDKLILFKDNAIYIKKDIVEGNYNISSSYSIEIIDIIDEEVAGIKKPQCDIEYKTYNVGENVSLPYLIMNPKCSEDGIIYYYRIVAIDPVGQVSYPSPLVSSTLSQKKEKITYLIQLSTNYYTKKDLADWSDLVSVPHDKGIIIGRPYKTMNSSPSQLGFEAVDGLLVNKSIPTIDSSDIKVNKTYIKSDDLLILTLPNIWACNEVKFNSRPRNAYRIKAFIENETSEFSDVIFNENNAEIDIEKMIIIKRNCTLDTDPLLASDINQPNTSVIKTFIRKNGLYYSSLDHGQCPYNIPVTYTDIIVMSRLSVFNELTITDNSCTSGQSYNYTIYLYDSFGNVSEPTTITINT